MTWLAVAALIVGAVVRFLKSDMVNERLESMGFPAIPKAVLPWVALVLGMASGALDAVLNGTDWPQAVAMGVVSGIGAIAGHQLVVESLRGGREILAPSDK